ncbi:hypothetical protein SNE40_003867 [Patella caerulea]|uniref:Apple domain-containing protein n=1 Tax=Patella caerulea TaxID=87958 RepID=A0AAN8Q948_PATCE
MFLELRILLVAFIIGNQMNNLNCLSTGYWLGFKNVIENVLPHSAKLRCTVSCKSEPHCAAFAFHQQRKECHLYTRNVEELGSDPDPGMDVFLVITGKV